MIIALSSFVYAVTCSSSPCSVDDQEHELFDYWLRDYLENSIGCGQSTCSTTNSLGSLKPRSTRSDGGCFSNAWLGEITESWLRFNAKGGWPNGDLKIYIDDRDLEDCTNRYYGDRRTLFTVPESQGSGSYASYSKRFDISDYKEFTQASLTAFGNPDSRCYEGNGGCWCYNTGNGGWGCSNPSSQFYSHFFDFEDLGSIGEWFVKDIYLDNRFKSGLTTNFYTDSISFSVPISNIKNPKLKFYLDGYKAGNYGDSQSFLEITLYHADGRSTVIYNQAEDVQETKTISLPEVSGGMYFGFYINGPSSYYKIDDIEIEYTIPECFSDADCGDPWYGGYYCEDNYVKQDYDTPTCNNPGTASADCTRPLSTQIIEDCYDRDGCNGDYYDEYSCSNAVCYVSNWDDCIDCSCSCGGYNTDESTANGNCNDGKDNDCDGSTDSSDSGCIVCVCSSGVCCDGCNYKSSGSQPTGYTDDTNGFCSGANSVTGTNYVKTRNYYCNGIDVNEHYTDTTVDTCSICEYCANNDLTCNYYSSANVCAVKDCDYLNNACREYDDVNRYCSGTSATCNDAPCNSYTNAPPDTFCEAEKICDANGNCNIIVKKFNITLNQGWNLISFPVDMMGKKFGDIFDHFSKIFAYYTKWFELGDNAKIYEQFGYWVKVDNDYILEIFGKEFTTPPDYDPQQGWNLVGYPTLTEYNISPGSTMLAYINKTWVSHIPNRAFNPLKTGEPGYGYWVKVG